MARDDIAFIATQHRLGVKFDRTLMLGRQMLLMDPPSLRGGFRDAGIPTSRTEARRLTQASGGYAEASLGRLGATTVDSMDVNDYEHSTIIHNLNDPLPDRLRESYDVVLDGGTLEHVFDYLHALQNALTAIRAGGHFITITPMNGYTGHGFYQFSPELFYGALGPSNGFRIVRMLMKPRHWRSRWRQVPNPSVVGHRIPWRGAWPTLLYVVAQRVEIKPLFDAPILQSDYLATWDSGTPGEARFEPSLKHRVRASLPAAVNEIRLSLNTWRHTRADLPVVRLRDI